MLPHPPIHFPRSIAMKTVGEKLDPFKVPAAKPGFNLPEENGV